MTIKRRFQAILFGVFFALLALIAMAIFLATVRSEKAPPDSVPSPHTISLCPGQTSLRLAMVHDVLHERYLLHSDAYWEARSKEALDQLEAVGALDRDRAVKLSDAVLDAFDVYGVCLDRLGRPSRAVEVMETKLAHLKREQPFATLSGGKLRDYCYTDMLKQLGKAKKPSKRGILYYKTHANLGTFLIHSAKEGVRSGDKKSCEKFQEGMKHIKTAISIHPGADFGRDTWQYEAAQHFLASYENGPGYVSYDISGNPQRNDVKPGKIIADTKGLTESLKWIKALSDDDTLDELPVKNRMNLRRHLTKLGSGSHPLDTQRYSPARVYFDQPCLGIVSMWALGDGPNPYFSMALANTMLAVGQKYLAWAGYERTKRLARSDLLNKKVRDYFIRFCDRRQRMIDELLPLESSQTLRTQFEEELAFGQNYQREYQDYEIRRLKEGHSPNSEDFYEDFFEGRDPIHSDVGLEDEILVWHNRNNPSVFVLLSASLLGFGLGIHLRSR